MSNVESSGVQTKSDAVNLVNTMNHSDNSEYRDKVVEFHASKIDESYGMRSESMNTSAMSMVQHRNRRYSIDPEQ